MWFMGQQTKTNTDVEHLASRIPLKCEGFFLLLPLNELSAIKTRTKEKLSRNKTIPETSFESKSLSKKKTCGGLFLWKQIWDSGWSGQIWQLIMNFLYFEHFLLLRQTYIYNTGNIVNKNVNFMYDITWILS